MNFSFPVLLFSELFILKTGRKSNVEYILVLGKIILALTSFFVFLKEMTLGLISSIYLTFWLQYFS